ncbi:MAG: DUF2064 domain-containing protein [Cyclobacteriaceae bacterium]
MIDAAEKDLLKGKGQSLNAQLTKALTTRTLQTARQSGLPIYQIDEQHQVGDTFGQRISNAFETVFSKGYDAVICIGNDAASLDHVKWDRLSISLSNGENVIGPDYRAGAYLIGLTRKSFNKEQFQNLRWQTKDLIADLKNFCETYNELEQVADLNNWDDLKLAARSFSTIRRILTAICGVLSIPVSQYRQISICSHDAIDLRGPPQFLLGQAA